LALAGVGLLVTRLFLAGGSWLAVGAVVVLVGVGAGLVWWLAERRSRLATERLRSGRGMAAGPGGRLLLVLAVCAFAVAVVNGILTFVLPRR
jgi:ABC-type Co2+ transport system permease subunit